MEQAALREPTVTPPLSLEEWTALPEDESGEWVDGYLVEEEVPDFIHEVVVGFFVELFRRWIVPERGLVAGSEAKFAIGSDRGRKPDVTVFFPDSKLPPARGLIRTPPDIAVEVVSPRPRDQRRDRIEKLAEYAAFGIRYYWIVEPQSRSLEIFELGDDGRYAHALGATEGTFEAVPGCAGLTLDLDALWAELDRLLPIEDEPSSEKPD